jgi:CRP-like cAMP-binding protein
MEYAARIGNRLLALLPPGDLSLLAPYLRKVPLERDALLVRTGDHVHKIHFPCSGLVVSSMDMPNGQTVATAMIGNDGASGMLAALGEAPSPVTVVVRVAGIAWEIPPARFSAALRRSTALASMVQIFTLALAAQLQQVAACNALHSVEERMAGALLLVHDRVEGNILPVTQETLSELLGVRRPTVTQVAWKLKQSGAIRSNRRGSIEIDRPRLEAAACPCHSQVTRRLEHILSQAPIRPRHHHAASEHKLSHRRESILSKFGS